MRTAATGHCSPWRERHARAPLARPLHAPREQAATSTGPRWRAATPSSYRLQPALQRCCRARVGDRHQGRQLDAGPGGSLVLRVHDADAAAAAVHVDEQVVELPLPRRVLVHVRAHAAHARGAARDELHLRAAGRLQPGCELARSKLSAACAVVWGSGFGLLFIGRYGCAGALTPAQLCRAASGAGPARACTCSTPRSSV